MRVTKLQLLSTIAHIIKKYDNSFCFASQAVFIELLAKHYGTHIKIRQLNYHLADLRRMGLIKSIKRNKRNPDGTICLQTSATCLTPHGYFQLFKLGVAWAHQRYKELIARYYPPTPKRQTKTQEWSAKEAAKRFEVGRRMFEDPDFRKAFCLDV